MKIVDVICMLDGAVSLLAALIKFCRIPVSYALVAGGFAGLLWTVLKLNNGLHFSDFAGWALLAFFSISIGAALRK